MNDCPNYVRRRETCNMSMTVGVPRILQWREFTWWGPGQGIWGTEVPQLGPGANPSRRSGRQSWSKVWNYCTIFNVFLQINACRSRGWTVYFANTQLKNSEDSRGGW